MRVAFTIVEWSHFVEWDQRGYVEVKLVQLIGVTEPWVPRPAVLTLYLGDGNLPGIRSATERRAVFYLSLDQAEGELLTLTSGG